MTPERSRLLRAVTVAYLAALTAALAVGAALAGRHPLLVTGAADLAATLVVFVASVRHDNSSLYDPYWSVAPVPIAAAWLTLGDPGGSSARGALAAGLLLAWAVRLTWNCLARWRSLAHEDFRYREIRARSGRFYWPASLFARSTSFRPSGSSSGSCHSSRRWRVPPGRSAGSMRPRCY
jgi:steroid 5-alpha reductase family enzyme